MFPEFLFTRFKKWNQRWVELMPAVIRQDIGRETNKDDVQRQGFGEPVWYAGFPIRESLPSLMGFTFSCMRLASLADVNARALNRRTPLMNRCSN
jgi:hypothetical protein